MASAILRCFVLVVKYWLAGVVYRMWKAFSISMLWLESTRCFRMDDLMVLIVPLVSPTGWCSLIRLCSCLVVRPIYRTPQEQVNWYMHMEVVKRGNLSFRLNLSIGDPVRTNFSCAHLNVLAILRFSFVLRASVIISSLNGNLMKRVNGKKIKITGDIVDHTHIVKQNQFHN